jgi:hypothetical protein
VITAVTAVAGLGVAAAAFASVVSMRAYDVTASNPPPHVFQINVAKGMVGPLRADAQASTFVAYWHVPDYIGRLESSTQVEMLWSKSIKPGDAWATATLKNASSTVVTELRFAGLFRTTHNDRRGTKLSVFLAHWPTHQAPRPVYRAGKRVETNVVVNGLIFAFGLDDRLAAVSVADKAVFTPTRCVIPSVCVTEIR